MDKKLLMIINPNAGQRQIRPFLFDLIELFCASGYRVAVEMTQRRDHASEIVKKRGSNYNCIVVCGGDGTIDEVINGMMMLDNKPPLGCIPAGTINDLANSFGIPKTVSEAGEQIVQGEPVDFDIGQFNGKKYFSYVAAFGALSDVSYQTSQGSKQILGRLAYYIQGLKSVVSIETRYVKVTHDKGSFEGEYIFGAISNSCSVGGFAAFKNEEVSLADGLFEGLFIKKPQNPLGYQQIVQHFLMQDYDERYMNFVQSTKFEIELDRSAAWTLDGEDSGEHTRITVETIPRAISVFRKPLEAETNLLLEEQQS